MAVVRTTGSAACRVVILVTRAVGLSIALMISVAAGAEDPVGVAASPTAMPAWAGTFSRLPHGLTEASSGAPEWWDNGPAVEPDLAGPDWGGLARDTGFLIGYQFVATAIIFLLPESVSGWSDDAKRHAGSRWLDHVKDPTIDSDTWFINYVAHPYFGAIYYIRARERGFDGLASFAYSALASAVYEFGVEAIFERPSVQDLVVTPAAGALIGAFVFEPIRSRILAKPVLAWYDHAGLMLTDPLGTLNGVFERLFGIKSNLRVNLKPPPALRVGDGSDGLRERAVGLELSIPWR